jgi:hypothetical protein
MVSSMDSMAAQGAGKVVCAIAAASDFAFSTVMGGVSGDVPLYIVVACVFFPAFYMLFCGVWLFFS